VSDLTAHPTVSVVLATRNGVAFVGAQVRSILGQSRPAQQIVVADDGSTDDTLAVVEAELAASPWRGDVITIRRDAALGVVGNVSSGLAAARGELVALADQDDVWSPDKLAVLVGRFEARPELTLVHSDARLVNAAGESLGETLSRSLSIRGSIRRDLEGGHAFDAYMRRNLVTGATVLARREALERALPVPPGWLHDEWFGVVAAALGEVEYVARPLIDYRQHGANEVGARELSMTQRWGRLSEPRTARNERLLRRAQVLPGRLRELGGDRAADFAVIAERKFRHELRRSALPASRVARVPGLFSGLFVGDYRRFGRGVADAVRDLVQPA
jgi:glycosyltransferase involved in cell wall biosynthesis